MTADVLLGLRFEEVCRARPRSLLSPFLDHDLVDVPATAGGAPGSLRTGPRVPFCAVVADVADADPTAVLRLGLAGDGVHVLGVWDRARGTVALEIAGPAGSASVPVEAGERAPSGLALVINGDVVTVLVKDADQDWRPVLVDSARLRELADPRDPELLRRLTWVHGHQGLRLARLRAGVSGPVGVRDPQVVRTVDGAPLIRDGKLFLTLTSAGTGFFTTAHWSVWTLDVADPRRLEQVGALFFARQGLVVGDHAGQLVVDERTGRVTVLVSSWGDFSPEAGVHVRALTTTDAVLSGVHVLESHPVELPTAHSAWDPSLARIDGRWHLGFVECLSFGPPRFVFRPALARTEDDDPVSGLVRVGADEELQQAEGTVLQRSGNRWYLLASDRDAAEFPVYETTAMRRVGSLQAPYGSNIPHPMVVPVSAARWWLVTFDGTPWHEDVLGYGTHGDVVVLAADVPRAPSRAVTGKAVRAAWRSLGEFLRG